MSPRHQPPAAPHAPEKKGRKYKYALRSQAVKVATQQAVNGPTAKPHPAQEPRHPPSKASGGVPDPTKLYLTQALGAPSLLPEPRRILIVVDLNGTLLYRPSKRHPFDFVERPHARRFLAYCLDTFHVAIWSSARPANVDNMVCQLLDPGQRERCLLTWARDRFGLAPVDYDARVQCYKRLTKIWADPAVVAAGRWDQSNTVLVDDSLEKARSEPYNILEIPEFSGVRSEPADVLPQVHDYLNLLCHQADISRFIRQNPFRLDPSYVLPPSPPE